MVTTKLNLSMTEPQVRQIYAKQGDTGRVLDITLDQTPEDGTLRILRPDGVEVTSEANLASDTYNVQTTPYYSGETTDLGMVMGTIEGKSEQDLNGQSEPYPAGGGKNLFYIKEQTLGGITVSLNADGSYKLNGSASSAVFLRSNVYTLKTGTYHLSASSSSSSNFLVRVRNADTSTLIASIAADGGNGVGVAVDTDTNVWWEITVFANSTLSNVNVYPQLETGTAKTSFAPYSNVCPVTSFSTTEFVSDGKNLITGFPNNTQFGVTFTTNADGSVTANGTATGGDATCVINATRPFFASFLGKKVILSGCPSDGSLSTYRLQWWRYATRNGVVLTVRDTGSGSDPFVPVETSGNIAIFIKNGTTVNNVTFKPMIRLASVTDDTYVPYQSPSTASVALTLRSLPDGTCDTYENGVVTRRVGEYEVTDVSQVGGSSSSSGIYPKWILGINTAPNVNEDYYDKQWSRQDAVICNMGSMVRESVSLDTNETTMSVYFHAYAMEIRPRPLVSNYPTLEEAKQAYVGMKFLYPITPTTETVTIPTLVTYENYTYVHNDSEVDPTSIEYKAIMLESGQVAIPSEATEVVGKCYCDVEQNGVSSMPFTLNVKKNERES